MKRKTCSPHWRVSLTIKAHSPSDPGRLDVGLTSIMRHVSDVAKLTPRTFLRLLNMDHDTAKAIIDAAAKVVEEGGDENYLENASARDRRSVV